ncbi:MAG TPA: hypothetical protein VK530_17260 [Candidatus Acidoferrum sp.]|nr:hypothetical protein [Candidatus Acidoferrum sp.]
MLFVIKKSILGDEETSAARTFSWSGFAFLWRLSSQQAVWTSSAIGMARKMNLNSMVEMMPLVIHIQISLGKDCLAAYEGSAL